MALLESKAAVITGSSRGFGLVIARAYAEADAAVVISSRTPSSVQQAVSDLQAQGYRALGVPCGVSDLAEVETLAQRTLDTFGRLNIWVNNAGIAGRHAPLSPAERRQADQRSGARRIFGSTDSEPGLELHTVPSVFPVRLSN